VKGCASCYRIFTDDGAFCPTDGGKLAPLSELRAPFDPDDGRVGRELVRGRYRIYRRVADGGMGRVYQALDTRENRSVALKILHKEVAADAVSLERFKREFKVSAALPHDYIVDVLGFEQTEDGSYALVMEYLEGEELRVLLKREKLMKPARVARMLAQVAIGLGAAHQRDIVHRDLKPDNLFLCDTPEGEIVKILDFGSVRDNSAGAKKLTVVGTTIGSPFYMSPEQAQGLDSLNHRADVWSLAGIVYEALVGRVPFEGSTGPAILLAILSREPVPPSEAGAAHGVPRSLDPVLGAALAKDPAQRLENVEVLADRVGHALGLSGSHRAWARAAEAELERQMEAGLPLALAAHDEATHRAAELSRMDQAFSKPEGAPQAFTEDLVMGVPSGPPVWLLPVVVLIAAVALVGGLALWLW
jgi:serine/threonine protein kinase